MIVIEVLTGWDDKERSLTCKGSCESWEIIQIGTIAKFVYYSFLLPSDWKYHEIVSFGGLAIYVG